MQDNLLFTEVSNIISMLNVLSCLVITATERRIFPLAVLERSSLSLRHSAGLTYHSGRINSHSRALSTLGILKLAVSPTSILVSY